MNLPELLMISLILGGMMGGFISGLKDGLPLALVSAILGGIGVYFIAILVASSIFKLVKLFSKPSRDKETRNKESDV